MFGLSATAIAGIAVGAAGVASAGLSYAASSEQEAAAMAGMDAQERSQYRAMEEQKRAAAKFNELMKPFIAPGDKAFKIQQDLAGMGSANGLKYQIQNVLNGPEYQQMIKVGNNNILQNASATGGLRGGNTEQALMTLSPTILNQLMNQRYQRVSDIANVGYNARLASGNAELNTGSALAQNQQNIGDAQATGALGVAQANANGLNAIGQGIGAIGGAVGGYFQNMPTANTGAPFSGAGSNFGSSMATADQYMRTGRIGGW